MLVAVEIYSLGHYIILVPRSKDSMTHDNHCCDSISRQTQEKYTLALNKCIIDKSDIVSKIRFYKV